MGLFSFTQEIAVDLGTATSRDTQHLHRDWNLLADARDGTFHRPIATRT